MTAEPSPAAAAPPRGAATRALDALWRLGLLAAYRTLLLWWRVARPRHSGALVALRHDGTILFVRHSYRRGWSIPGGGIGRGETPATAAAREAAEEVGIALDPAALRPALVYDETFEHRHARVHILGIDIARRPALRIDNREIVEAAFLDPAALPAGAVPPHLAAYLRGARGGP